MPYRLHHGDGFAYLPSKAVRLSRGLDERRSIPQWPKLFWHRVAPRSCLWRTVVFLTVFLSRPRSTRSAGPLRGLLATKLCSCPDQSRVLHIQSAWVFWLRPRLLGTFSVRW